MPLRLWRRKQILPGVRLNISRSGPSVSFGPRGLHYTVGHGRRRATIGVPGTGVYYTTYSHRHARTRAPARARRTTTKTRNGTDRQPTLHELWAMSPGRKIGMGMVYTVIVITAPIGIPLLITGLLQLGRPVWRMRALVARASRQGDPQQELRLLEQARALQPDSPEVLAPLAEWHYRQARWVEAADLYRRYLDTASTDWQARGHLGHALLEAGALDAAIEQLEAVRDQAPLTEESHASVTANLAIAHLARGDTGQALALLRAEPLQKHTLADGLQQCLYWRAVSEYLSGQRARALGDLDRLYAANTAFAHLQETRDAFTAGTYTFRVPG